MIAAGEFYNLLKKTGISFFTGVPDSQLKEFCNFLYAERGIDSSHIIAPNEGSAVALAAGSYLSTGQPGLVYMQNSGLGNALNPVVSLTDPRVYAIPVLFLIGWRGMPGVHDEPQHIKQGDITLDLLRLLEIDAFVINKETTLDDVDAVLKDRFSPLLKQGKSAAFVMEKESFLPFQQKKAVSDSALTRESAICTLVDNTAETDIIVSTTGKASRELFEYRQRNSAGHHRDFLTVGSMGHASMIALKIAENNPDRRVWCFDGDGAVLMHLGAVALIGARKPKNFMHVILNNCAHESVGGMPTVAGDIDFLKIAESCGYAHTARAQNSEEIEAALKIMDHGLGLLEIKVNLSSRKNLGRPTTTPVENKQEFMRWLGS